MWEEIWEKGRELLVPALLPAFHVVTEGPRRLLGQEMTGHSESQGLLKVGGALTTPPAGGGCQGGGWEENQAYPCRREEREHLCEGTGGLVPRRIQGSRREGDVSTGPEAHGICVIPCSSH